MLAAQLNSIIHNPAVASWPHQQHMHKSSVKTTTT